MEWILDFVETNKFPIGLTLSGGTLIWLYRQSRSGTVPLAGKAVLITGCDSGFGYSLALHLAANTDLVIIAGCYVPDGDRTGADSLDKDSGGKIHVVGNFLFADLDVTNAKSISSAVSATRGILASNGLHLWCVVNNAASLVFADAEWQTMAMAERQLAVNVLGPLAVTKAFLPLLRESKGRIVNMISFCTDCPLPTLTTYTASKAALRSMSAGMRMELAKYGVDVVMFNPGDHPGETPLCSGQDRYYAAMEAEVDAISDAAVRVRPYFDAYRKKFTSLFPKPQLKKLDNPGYYKTFEAIVSSQRPKAEYTNSDLGTIGFFGILGLLPTKWSDRARIALMRLPKL